MWWQKDHYVLRCRGCETVFHRQEFLHSEMHHYGHDPDTGEEEFEPEVTQWPPPAARPKPDWIKSLDFQDGVLGRLTRDVYIALDTDLPVLAGMGMRTVFDRASEILKIDPAKSFAEKLNDLLAGGWIGQTEKDNLDLLTNAGGAAAHRGWRPSAAQLDTLMGILENFLHRTFILNAQAKKLKSKIPTKPKRKKP